MSTSTLASSARQRALSSLPADEATLPARARASFARLRGRFASTGDRAWALSLQPEHLLAYATWGETLLDPESGAMKDQ